MRILSAKYRNLRSDSDEHNCKKRIFPDDPKGFGGQFLEKLYNAGKDLQYLLNQGYQIKGASTFVGNHYLLFEGQYLNIDGFNTIITLEVALAVSLLLKCMDGTIRDLAALRGTYRLIDKTESAIIWIGKTLEMNRVGKAVFYLDAPVSNSGRLKQKILELLNSFNFEVQVEVIHNVDAVLEKLDNVITSDAIILDKYTSWINLNAKFLENIVEKNQYIEFFGDKVIENN